MMAIKGRYEQVSDTSHGCQHEELATIVDDGWEMIQCGRCLKRWDSATGKRRHMSFLEALRARRPMRRRRLPDGLTGPWISQVLLPREDRPQSHFAEPWVRADTGAHLTLSREDYLADDWEVQP